MIHDIPWQLLEKYFANETNPLENQKVKEWIDSASENAMIYEQLQEHFNTSGSLPIEFIPDKKAALVRIHEKLNIKPRMIQLSHLWWKVAAVLLIGLGCWLFVYEKEERQLTEIPSVLETDSTVTSIILSDGSQIWLNAHSSIKYPKKFGDIREVNLEGEAYFEIAHDSRHPFVVNSAGTRTQVLGTKFNIRSYTFERQVNITVSEGKVDFGSDDNKQVLLTINQTGTFDKFNSNVTKAENNNYNFMSWKTLEFQFDNQPLEIVFNTLTDAYHFNFQFDTPDIKNRMLTANFNHRPLEEIIQTISLSAKYKFH